MISCQNLETQKNPYQNSIRYLSFFKQFLRKKKYKWKPNQYLHRHHTIKTSSIAATKEKNQNTNSSTNLAHINASCIDIHKNRGKDNMQNYVIGICSFKWEQKKQHKVWRIKCTNLTFCQNGKATVHIWCPEREGIILQRIGKKSRPRNMLHTIVTQEE